VVKVRALTIYKGLQVSSLLLYFNIAEAKFEWIPKAGVQKYLP
jgi:hypothetical protein